MTPTVGLGTTTRKLPSTIVAAESAGRRRARRLGKACAPLGEALFSDDDECHAASSARLRCSLRTACVSCDAAAIRRVLERSSDLASHVYDDGFTPLGYVLHGDQGDWRCGRGLASVKLVLDARAAPDVVCTRAGSFTSLQLAVYGSNENPREPRVALELVKLLLAAGAGARDRGVLSGACEVACSVGHVMCCRTLLEARAAPTSACVRGAIVPGGTATGAREPAEERRMPDELRAVVVRMLLQAGADANECADAPGGLTLLMVACAYGRARCARELLRGRADVWATDRARPPRTALAWARNNVDCTAVLRAAGAGQEEGLLHAARSGDQCALGALLASGVPAHAGGNHALSAACRGAHVGCVRLLLDARAPPDGVAGRRTGDPLSLAVFGSAQINSALVQILLDAKANPRGASVRLRGGDSVCALEYACRRMGGDEGARAVVLPLMEAGAIWPRHKPVATNIETTLLLGALNGKCRQVAAILKAHSPPRLAGEVCALAAQTPEESTRHVCMHSACAQRMCLLVRPVPRSVLVPTHPCGSGTVAHSPPPAADAAGAAAAPDDVEPPTPPLRLELTPLAGACLRGHHECVKHLLLARCSPIFPAVQLRRQPREADGGEALDAGTLTAAALGSCSEVIALIRSAIADELIGRAISSPRNATDEEDDEPVTTVGQGQAWHDGGPRPSLPPAAVASVQFDLEDADGSPPRLAEACTYVTLQSNDGSGACRVVTLQEVLGLLEDEAVATAADDDEEEEEEVDDDDDDAVDDVDDEVAGGSATLPAARHEHAKLAGGPTLLRVKFARLTDRRKKKERRRLRREAEAEAAAVESQARAAAARCEASAERARAKATQNEAAVKAATTSTDAAVTAPAAERTATREQAASEAAARVAAAHAHEEELAFEATLQRALEESLRTVTAPIAEPAADPAAGPAVSHAQRVPDAIPSQAEVPAAVPAASAGAAGSLRASSTSVPALRARATGRGADADRLPSALLATSPSPIQAAAPYICPPTAGGETALQVIAVGASRVTGSQDSQRALLRHISRMGDLLAVSWDVCVLRDRLRAEEAGRRARADTIAAEHAAMRVASEKLEAGVRLRAATERRVRDEAARLRGARNEVAREEAAIARNVGALGVGSRLRLMALLSSLE